jgi:hypothetical protein
MRLKGFFKNETGVSTLLEYILFSLMVITFFMTISVNADDIFLERPNSVVVYNEFSDIGNMMSTMLTDMYLIIPANGMIETDYRIPARAGFEEYTINADIAMTDQIIEVASTTSDKKVRVTIGGIATTMPINGTAYSSSTNHVISYDSRR